MKSMEEKRKQIYEIEDGNVYAIGKKAQTIISYMSTIEMEIKR